MRNSSSFQGLCPLDPHQGSALDPLAAHSTPRPPAGIRALPRRQFHIGPPNRRTSHQKPPEKSTGRCVTQGCQKARSSLSTLIQKMYRQLFCSLIKKKPFDRVNHSYLSKILEKISFGPAFISWVQTKAK